MMPRYCSATKVSMMVKTTLTSLSPLSAETRAAIHAPTPFPTAGKLVRMRLSWERAKD